MVYLQTFALKILGLTLDTAKLAKQLADREQRTEAALKILGLTSAAWLEAKKMAVSGTKEAYSRLVLGIENKELLKQFLVWSKLSKEERVEEMVDHIQQIADKGDSPRAFFTGVYTRYFKFKVKRRSSWKSVEDPKLYLNKIKGVVDACIIKDSMSLDEAQRVCIYAYFYMKLKLIGSKVEETQSTKVITLHTQESQKKVA